MKKKSILLVIIVIFLGVISFSYGKTSKKEVLKEGISLNKVNSINTLSMMLETMYDSGEYTLETRSSWPTEGYVFNEELSKCENGGSLSWDDENNVIVMSGSTSDKCYVYFDKLPILLASWVKEEYAAQTAGSETIYYHDSSLENGAGDNSYRYSGSSSSVNNYVCFGSDEETCPYDNLYRIIGVFGDQVKLIKWDYATTSLLGTDGDYNTTCSSYEDCNYGIANNYYKGSNTGVNIGVYNWNHANYSATLSETGYYSVWSYSKLNTVNLNTNFINKTGSAWSNKIAETTWKVGGNTNENIYNSNSQTAYINEIVNPDTTIESTYKAKVALMYTSDYGFAASPSAWTTNLGSYSSYINDNWMYMGLFEWTVVRNTETSFYAFLVDFFGTVDSNLVVDDSKFNEDGLIYAFAIRPVFYLNSDVTFVSGNGTKNSPIRIL